jgi:DNA-binding NtrC family response regulator
METILVVDDDALVLQVLVKILSVAKFRVLSANSGQQALQISDTIEGSIDLLLSYVETLEMTGPDLVEVLRKSRPNIRVILMSPFPNGRIQAIKNGWAFIQKPFAPQQLIEMVTEVIRTQDNSGG